MKLVPFLPMILYKLFFPVSASAAWVVWLENLAVKTEAEVTEYLSFLHVLGNQSSWLLLERAHVFLPFITHTTSRSFFCCP